MANKEQNSYTENSDVEYSGAHFGDERDPKTLGEILPFTEAEIMERAQNPDLWTARSRVIELENAVAGDLTSAASQELAEAKEALVLQEQQESARRLGQSED